MCHSYKAILMKKLYVLIPLLALVLGGVRAQALVAESAEWATKI